MSSIKQNEGSFCLRLILTEMFNPKTEMFTKILKPDSYSEKKKTRKFFLILFSTLEELYNDATHDSLRCYEYIDQPKLTGKKIS